MTTNIVDTLNAVCDRKRVSDAEVARIAGMTTEEYDADVTCLDHADLPWDDDSGNDHPPDKCYNCGCYGEQNPWHMSEYRCPQCGDVWDVFAEPPDIP